jgi:hypothetical protein
MIASRLGPASRFALLGWLALAGVGVLAPADRAAPAAAGDDRVLVGAAFRDERGDPVPGGCVIFAAGPATAARACDQEPGDEAPDPGDVGVRLAAGEYDFILLAPPGYQLTESGGGTIAIGAGAPDALPDTPVARVVAADARFVVHAAWCPADGPAAYARCRGNAQAGVTFAANGQAMTTDAAGDAEVAVPAGALNVAVDPAVAAVSVGTYVVCVDRATGGVVLATEPPPPPPEPLGGIGFLIAAGQTVACDWYNLTAPGAGEASPVASPGALGSATPAD